MITTERKAELLNTLVFRVMSGETVMQATDYLSRSEAFAAAEVLRTVIPDTSHVRTTAAYDALDGMTQRIRITWLRRALKRERLILSRERKKLAACLPSSR